MILYKTGLVESGVNGGVTVVVALPVLGEEKVLQGIQNN
jgi:hypothetical protein